MSVGAIWSQTASGVIGNRASNSILWRYKSDMRRFKALTMGAAIVMGRKTWDSIGKPLPGRLSIVLTRRDIVRSWAPVPDGSLLLVNDSKYPIEKAIAVAKAAGKSEVWIIGGGEVYALAMPHVEMLDVTTVPDVVAVDADAVLAPAIERSAWRSVNLTPFAQEADAQEGKEWDRGLSVTRYFRRELAG